MTPAHLALIVGIVLTASPAVAAVNPGNNPALESRRKPASGVEKLFQLIVETNPAALPLECRGYYVRMKSSHAPADRLNRCD